MKIGAMKVVVGVAEFLDACVPERTGRQDLTGLPVTDFTALRREGDRPERFFQSQFVQDAGAIRADLYAGADFAERARLLQDADIEPFAREAIGKGKPAQTCAGDDDSFRSIGLENRSGPARC